MPVSNAVYDDDLYEVCVDGHDAGGHYGVLVLECFRIEKEY